MMRIQCTEGYTPKERLHEVAKEVLHEYPAISIDDAMKIAVMTDVVPEKVEVDDIFKRFYYILWIIGRYHPIYERVYRDMKLNCEGELKSPINIDLYEKIIQYTNRQIENFPPISQYY